jgi:septum formation protein
MDKLILGSVSPRRKELMALGGWKFTVMPANVDESLLEGEGAQEYVLRIAEEKARTVGKLAPPGRLVISADTTVVDPEGVILAKPLHEGEAYEMLDRLRDRTHQVITGVVVFDTSQNLVQRAFCTTHVHMRSYTDPEIQSYIASGDPFDKAGGYAIQHDEFHPVEQITGCYANVVGLPVCTLARLLKFFGHETQVQVPEGCPSSYYSACSVCEQLENNF